MEYKKKIYSMYDIKMNISLKSKEKIKVKPRGPVPQVLQGDV